MKDCIEYNNSNYPRAYNRGDRHRIEISRLILCISDPNFYLNSNLEALHTCDNPKCIKIEHLFSGSVLDNIKDAQNKGKFLLNKQAYCKRGHEFTKANTYLRLGGRKECRKCMKLRDRGTI